jgi:glycosyltransferase involved in cell wall biosynthesis
MKLLYVQFGSFGGLADYSHEQANAMGELGVEVQMLAARRFFQSRQGAYSPLPLCSESDYVGEGGSLWIRRFRNLSRILHNYAIVSQTIVRHGYRHVLFGSYAEYFSPLWAWRLCRLSRKGIVFGSVVHDPVRDFVLGPLWWHQRSVAGGYSFQREAFVHEEITLDTGRPMPRLRTTVIPHGPYRFPQPTESPTGVRQRLRLPEQAFVMLSFGHIRDGKNLDLIIKAMSDLPSVYLIVAGKEQSSGQKALDYYQELARSLKVDDRCRWFHGHVSEKEVGNLFITADLIMLTYSRNFRSASGVLNAAITYRKPCVASCGGGNLRSVVERYNLGWFVEPDDTQALASGIMAGMNQQLNSKWKTYEAENSWEQNARIVRERMFD